MRCLTLGALCGSCFNFTLGDPLILNEISKVMVVKIVMIEMIKSMNKIAPYIGLSDTFRPRRVVVRTSALWVVGRASTLGRVHSMGHRVELDSWDQGQRSKEEAS